MFTLVTLKQEQKQKQTQTQCIQEKKVINFVTH